MNTGLEFDPIDYYQKDLKSRVKDKTTNLLDTLVKENKVDIQKNKTLSKEIYALQAKIDESEKSRNIFNVIRIILIILAVVGGIFCLFGLFTLFNDGYSLFGILSTILGGAVLIVSLLIIFLVINKKHKEESKKLTKLKAKQAKLKSEAYATVAPLINSFNFKHFVNLINGLDTVLSVDEELDQYKLFKLRKLYNEKFIFGENESILDIYSGNIDKNPYVRVLVTNQKMYNHDYTGTRTVTWRETYHDSEGHLRTRTESETLIAHYSAPAPRYSTSSYIIYGNGAAPKLRFTRGPSGLNLDHDDKDVEKLVKKRSKEIEDRQEDAIKDGKTFTPLANLEFESLFYALDRNNETEYRLLFTPLAQQNMVELITAKEPYGDDFYFIKENKVNYIFSNHASRSIRFPYTDFYTYFDYEKLYSDFVSVMCSEFESLYFAAAPLLAIPLYQMDEAPLFEDKSEKEILTEYEAEVFANSMNKDLFRPEEAVTEQILKVRRTQSLKNSDLFEVTSHAFSSTQMVTYVPVVCRNGRVYDVPVYWYQYDPVSKTSNIAICKIKEQKEKTQKDGKFNYNIYRHNNFGGCYLDNDLLNESNEDTFVSKIENTYNLIK